MSTYGPIEEKARKQMNQLAELIDSVTPEGMGFCLLMFEMNNTKGDGRMNYISNANRESMVLALKEFVARNEGRDYKVSKRKQ